MGSPGALGLRPGDVFVSANGRRLLRADSLLLPLPLPASGPPSRSTPLSLASGEWPRCWTATPTNTGRCYGRYNSKVGVLGGVVVVVVVVVVVIVVVVVVVVVVAVIVVVVVIVVLVVVVVVVVVNL